MTTREEIMYTLAYPQARRLSVWAWVFVADVLVVVAVLGIAIAALMGGR